MTISESSEDIPWERTSDGKTAGLVRPPQVRNAGAYLRALAYAKLTGVHAISAAFKGEPVYFERRIVILSEETSSMRVTSLFLAGEAVGAAPAVCIRTATWERDTDYRSFEAASSKKTYALSSSQFESQIRFYGANHDRVIRLLHEIETRLRQGVSMPGAPDSNDFIRFEIYLDQFNVCVSFACDSGRDLETIVRKCESELVQFARSVEVLPDDGCRISYERSVWERIDSFPG